MTVLVIGATGKTGRAVVEALSARGVEVHAATRTPAVVPAGRMVAAEAAGTAVAAPGPAAAAPGTSAAAPATRMPAAASHSPATRTSAAEPATRTPATVPGTASASGTSASGTSATRTSAAAARTSATESAARTPAAEPPARTSAAEPPARTSATVPATRAAEPGTRTPATALGGVRQVRFDWADRTTWAPALEGAEGLYIVGPYAHPTGESLVGELLAEAADTRRVTLLSVLGADRLPPEVMMADWERDVRASGKQWTILRPNWFFQNFGSAFAAGLRDQGVLELPAADAALSFVDTRDVGAVAAATLAEDGHAGRVYDITGPQTLTYAEAVKILGDAAGRELTYRAISHEQSAERLRAAGVRERSVVWQRGLYDLILDGANAPVTPVVEQVTGRPARTLVQYAAENAEIWR